MDHPDYYTCREDWSEDVVAYMARCLEFSLSVQTLLRPDGLVFVLNKLDGFT